MDFRRRQDFRRHARALQKAAGQPALPYAIPSIAILGRFNGGRTGFGQHIDGARAHWRAVIGAAA
jgi:hypothetical protein